MGIHKGKLELQAEVHRLENLAQTQWTPATMDNRRHIRSILVQIYYQEELLLQDKAIIRWVTQGERNTSFFNHSPTIRGKSYLNCDQTLKSRKWLCGMMFTVFLRIKDSVTCCLLSVKHVLSHSFGWLESLDTILVSC